MTQPVSGYGRSPYLTDNSSPPDHAIDKPVQRAALDWLRGTATRSCAKVE
jgi:hypothetical protein